MDLDRPHRGALDSDVYIIQDLAALKAIVSRELSPEICISIFRRKQYPIRGLAGEALLATALHDMPDHQWFSIISPGTDVVTPFNVIGWGDCRAELRDEFNRHRGKTIYVGQNPFDDYVTARGFLSEKYPHAINVDPLGLVRKHAALAPDGSSCSLFAT